MRLIGEIKSETQLKKISLLLQKKGIEHSYEFIPKTDKVDGHFNLWIVEEDKVEQAQKIFDDFLSSKNSDADDNTEAAQEQESKTIFETPPISDKSSIRAKPKFQVGLITNILIGLCVFFFIMQEIQFAQIEAKEKNAEQQIQIITPLMTWMLYDFPKTYQLIAEFQNRFESEPFQDDSKMTLEEKALRNEILQTPVWQGIYPLLIAQFNGERDVRWDDPKFGDILDGQVWRIFTPIFLHAGLVHLLFNMLWLFVLGTPIERRIGKYKYLLLVLATAGISNTAQYLMSGALFLGYSGVTSGYAGFIYSRKKKAPWEGYPIQRVVLWFIFGYILVFLALQLFNFTLSALGFNIGYGIFFNMANTAHVVGLITGLVLGRFNLFAWSTK